MSERRAILEAEVTGDLDALAVHLASADPTHRTLALGSLMRLGRLDDDRLREALDDEDRDVRCRAIELVVAPDTYSSPAPPRSRVRYDFSGDLVDLLGDDDDLVVETAAWALGEKHADSGDSHSARHAVDRLSMVATGHTESICREAAVAALGAIGANGGLPAILAGMDDRATVRRRAVLALAPFDGDEVLAALRRATTDRDRQVRQAAEDLLGDG